MAKDAEADESAAVEPTSAAVELTEADATADSVVVEEVGELPSRGHSLRLAGVIGLVVVVLLAVLTGWLGYRANESHRAQQQRELFLKVGREAATNLTSIDWEHAEEDVQRVLDTATGTFYDDFAKRAQPFTEVVKQAKSKSVGQVAEAGVQSETDGGAKILVAVTVNTSNVGAPQQPPRGWRMLLTVQKIGDEAKVSNVEFVS